MTLGMDHVIVVIKGDITDKKLLKKLRVDAIVNAANPTLMGSDQGVDGAIHAKLPKLKKRICKELGTDRLANRQRCGRGKAVTTSDGEKERNCAVILYIRWDPSMTEAEKYAPVPGYRHWKTAIIL